MNALLIELRRACASALLIASTVPIACGGGDSPASRGGDGGAGTPSDSGGDTSTVDASPDASPDGAAHALDISPKNALLMLDTAKASAAAVSQVYAATLDGADATAATTFTVSDTGYGSFSGAKFVSSVSLPGLAVAGTIAVQGTNAGANATTNLTLIALKLSGDDPDPFDVLPYMGTTTTPTATVKLVGDLGTPQTTADLHTTLTNGPSNGAADATAFVRSITAMDQGDATLGCPAHAAKDTGSGVLDTFLNVVSNTPVCFKITFKDNASVPAKRSVQVLELVATLIADPGARTITTKRVYLFVPPVP